MSTRIIKKKIPYLDQFQSIDDAFNYLVKELNASRVSSGKITQTENVSQMAQGEAKAVTFVHPGAPVDFVSATTTHSLGVTPSAVLYAGQSHVIDALNSTPAVWRVSSMTPTNVTIEMKIDSGTRVHNFFILK